MIKSCKCDVHHIPSCMFDNKANIYLMCWFSHSTWEHLANKILSEALPTLATSNFLLHNIQHLGIRALNLSYANHKQPPRNVILL